MKNDRIPNVKLGTTVSIMLLLVGCTTNPVKDTGFLDNPEKMTKKEGIPVQRVWKDPQTSIADYDNILIKPIFTKKMLENSTLEKANIHTWLSNENKNVAEFAKYMKNAFKEAVKKSKRFNLVTKPGPRTMILELSLVKVVPGKPILGAIANLSNLTPIGFLISPLKMTANAASDSPTQSSVAIEGRILDAQTGNAIAMFADRRKERTAFFNTKDFRPYGNPEQIADEWADDFIRILEKRPKETGKNIDQKSNVRFINY